MAAKAAIHGFSKRHAILAIAHPVIPVKAGIFFMTVPQATVSKRKPRETHRKPAAKIHAILKLSRKSGPLTSHLAANF
jgi:hypothetical protein